MFLPPNGVGMTSWDPNGPEYQCCCGNFHVRVAAAIIAVIESIVLLANFIASIAVPQLGGYYGPSYEVSLD